MISEDKISKLKDSLINRGIISIEEFVGRQLDDYELEDIDGLLEETIDQMPEEELKKFMDIYIPKIVIFDVDDVMYDLNKRVSEIKSIPYEKFIMFNIYENPAMTEEERKRVLAAYTEAETYEKIEFYQPVIDLINQIDREYPGYEVHICSNNATKAVKDTKLKQLRGVLDIPDERLHMHVIDMATESLQKELPDDIFLIVDDSIHNLEMAKAEHKIMPGRKHNETVLDENGCLNGEKIERTESIEELVETIVKYLEG